MINLLPTETKLDIRYARMNTLLRKWIIFALIALAGVGIIVVFGILYLNNSVNDYTSQLESQRQSLQNQKVDVTQKRVEEISTNTKLAVQVLSREVLFSKLIRQIGSALPNNTALSNLQIDQLQGGVQLNANAADFNSATQLQLNLQDPKNGVFDKADINDITCAEEPPEGSFYRCSINLRALFSKNNSYLFISPQAGGAAQ